MRLSSLRTWTSVGGKRGTVRHVAEVRGSFVLDDLGVVGPLLGVILVDYFFVRRQRVRVADLYSESATGAYAYKRGWNPVALWALGSGAVFAIVLGVLFASKARLLIPAVIAGAALWGWVSQALGQ